MLFIVELIYISPTIILNNHSEFKHILICLLVNMKMSLFVKCLFMTFAHFPNRSSAFLIPWYAAECNSLPIYMSYLSSFTLAYFFMLYKCLLVNHHHHLVKLNNVSLFLMFYISCINSPVFSSKFIFCLPLLGRRSTWYWFGIWYGIEV